jgi:NAD-dependent deacetylase
MEDLNPGSVETIREQLASTRRVTVLTGAGISAESGVPTFRGGGGTAVWRGMPFERLSSAKMIEEDLPLVWEWFDYRRGVLSGCQPNSGHKAIAEAAAGGRFSSFSLVTQNIDGLHQRAGSPDVIELHGSINEARCLNCDQLRNLSEIEAEERPPLCPGCGDAMRPNVVLFEEMLPIDALTSACDAAANCDICLVVGTSALVYPANELPYLAKTAGAFIVEINPEETPLTPFCDASLRGKAAAMLPELFGT